MVYQLFVQKESYLSLYFLLLFFGFRLRNFFHLQYLQIEIPLTLLRLAVQTDVTANISKSNFGNNESALPFPIFFSTEKSKENKVAISTTLNIMN